MKQNEFWQFQWREQQGQFNTPPQGNLGEGESSIITVIAVNGACVCIKICNDLFGGFNGSNMMYIRHFGRDLLLVSTKMQTFRVSWQTASSSSVPSALFPSNDCLVFVVALTDEGICGPAVILYVDCVASVPYV